MGIGWRVRTTPFGPRRVHRAGRRCHTARYPSKPTLGVPRAGVDDVDAFSHGDSRHRLVVAPADTDGDGGGEDEDDDAMVIRRVAGA